MSTRPCLNCGAFVPVTARFCGQCGTAPEVIPMPAPTPTPVGIDARTLLASTVVDHAPLGMMVDAAAPRLQTNTPVVPPPRPIAEDETTSPALNLARTFADPDMAGRAREMVEAALLAAASQDAAGAAAPEPAPVPPAAHPAPAAGGRARGALGKTMMLGGAADSAPPAPAPAPPAPAPAPPAVAPTPAASQPQEFSPLSRSVLSPSSWLPAGAAASPQAPAQPPVQSMQPAPVVAVPGPEALAPAPAPAPSYGRSAGARTMLGMPSSELPEAPRSAAPPAHPNAAAKTMIGVAIPGIAPTHQESAAAPSPHAPAPAPAPAGAAALRPIQATMMGVAMPGIAPLHAAPSPVATPRGVAPTAEMYAAAPAQAQPAPMQGYAPYAEGPAPAPPPPIVPPPPPMVEEPLPEPLALPEKRGVPAVAVVGILFVLVAILGAGAFFIVQRSSTPLTAQPQLDENGRESLRIHCESCPDGTMVSLGASTAKVESAKAVLPLPAPLSIGENDLSVHVDRPGSGRDEDVKIHVPVAYRVKADLTTLGDKPPTVTVRVEATAGSTVSVDGKPITLDGTGRCSYAIDISADTNGPSDEQRTVDKRIPFEITPKGGHAETGTLTARAAVLPLRVDAPGLNLYTDAAAVTVAGRTRPNATVNVDGRAAPADAQGRFTSKVSLGENAEKRIEIVASSPPLTPRTLTARVTRVASLEAAAKTLDAETPITFAAFGAEPATKTGQKAVVEGDVVEIRLVGGVSVILVGEKKGCAKGAQCLVRIVHGEEVKLAAGDPVRAYGKLIGAVAWKGKNVPDIESSLVLPLRKGPRL